MQTIEATAITRLQPKQHPRQTHTEYVGPVWRENGKTWIYYQNYKREVIYDDTTGEYIDLGPLEN